MIAQMLLAVCLLATATTDRVDLAVAWVEGKPQATLVVRDLPAELPAPPAVAMSDSAWSTASAATGAPRPCAAFT